MKDALNSTTQPSRRLASQRAKHGAKHVSRGGMTLFPELDGSSRDALRRAFFGGAALLAQRFGVTDEDIAIHLERVAARSVVHPVSHISGSSTKSPDRGAARSSKVRICA